MADDGSDDGGGASPIDRAGDKLGQSARQIGGAIGRAYRNMTGKSVGTPITLGGLRGGSTRLSDSVPARGGVSSNLSAARTTSAMNRSTAASGHNFRVGAGAGALAGAVGLGAAAHGGGSVADTTKGASAPASGSPIHQPVSHPGTQATHTPMKAAVGNRGHATTHPASPGTSQSSARHPKAQHATAKATGGTQHAGSHGAKAGHAAHKGGKKPSKKKGKKK